MTIPLDAIDPAAQSDRWLRAFEHHLDLIPPLMEAIVTMTIPHIRADQLKPRITGGGYPDNVTAFLSGVGQDVDGRLVGVGAAADVQLLWWWLVSFTRAVAVNVKLRSLPPVLADKPDADPLTARAVALTTVGWLIDHADQIEQLTVYEQDIDQMFSEIRHLRGKYGVYPNPRRPRARCTVCGTLSVVITWVDNPTGSAKPVKAGRCRECGQTYTEPVTPVVESPATSREVRSESCADLLHEMCESVHCGCSCHSLIRGDAV